MPATFSDVDVGGMHSSYTRHAIASDPFDVGDVGGCQCLCAHSTCGRRLSSEMPVIGTILSCFEGGVATASMSGVPQ